MKPQDKIRQLHNELSVAATAHMPLVLRSIQKTKSQHGGEVVMKSPSEELLVIDCYKEREN